jgi:uncharacterized protein (DUF1684 family)
MSIVDETITARDTWQQWRAQRAEDLSAPFGWLSLTALIWLSDEPAAYRQLPGKWWGTQGKIFVQANATDKIAVGDSSTSGEIPAELGFEGLHEVEVPEASSTIGAVLEDGTRVEFITRTGQPALRLRGTQVQPLADGGLVPVFAYDPQWVKSTTLTWYPTAIQEQVTGAQPGLIHNVQVVGQIEFEHEGLTYALKVVGQRGGPAQILFTDTAPGTAPWRILSLPVVESASESTTLEVDFNYTYNLPYAFSDYGTCPAPLPENVLKVAIAAGEKSPR